MKSLSLTTLTTLITFVLLLQSGKWAPSEAQSNGGNSVGHRMDGKQTFEHEEFGGNGRTCVTCHSTETGTVSPADAQARFAADPTDPLFRAKDSDDGTGSSYNRLLTWGIFRVTLPTNANIVPDDDPTATEVDLFRGTGNTINTAPLVELLMNDGREDDLEEQALGAVHAHFDNAEEPDAKDLQRIAEFQHTRQFFSSDELYDFDNGGAPPELPPGNTEAEIRGRAFFAPTGMCGKCHGGAMLNTQNNGGRFTTSLVTAPVMTVLPRPNPNRTWRVWNPQTNRFVNRIAEDPGRILQTGVFNHFGQFRIPTLWNVKNTAPYFHNNSAADLDILLRHYQEFFTRPPVFEQLDDDEIPDVKAYLLLL